MVAEVLRFAVQGILHAFLSVDILLATINNADKAKFEGIHATGEDVERVRARIHEVEFRQNANGATALWVDCPREFERF